MRAGGSGSTAAPTGIGWPGSPTPPAAIRTRAATRAATVTGNAQGVALTSTTQQVPVAANGTARVRFTGTASENAAASFQFTVAMNGERDSVNVTIPVRRPRVVETRTLGEGRAAADQK